MAFKPEKLNPQNNFKIEGYINLLNSIGNKLTIITNKAPKCEKYYLTLFLYVKLNYDKESITDLSLAKEMHNFSDSNLNSFIKNQLNFINRKRRKHYNFFQIHA